MCVCVCVLNARRGISVGWIGFESTASTDQTIASVPEDKFIDLLHIIEEWQCWCHAEGFGASLGRNLGRARSQVGSVHNAALHSLVHVDLPQLCLADDLCSRAVRRCESYLPPGFRTQYSTDGADNDLCGAVRPGHSSAAAAGSRLGGASRHKHYHHHHQHTCASPASVLSTQVSNFRCACHMFKSVGLFYCQVHNITKHRAAVGRLGLAWVERKLEK